MRTICESLLTFAGATAALVLVTACNNESGTAPTTPVMSQAQAESLATTVVADIAGEIGTATMDGAGGLAATAPFDASAPAGSARSEEHTSELQSRLHLVCRLLLEKKKKHN